MDAGNSISDADQLYADPGRPGLVWRDISGGPEADEPDGSDVVRGLTAHPKVLPPKYFYDDPGSQLFERITDQPEYYPTRTEASILRQSAAEVAALTGRCDLVELGSGSSRKTRVLLQAYADAVAQGDVAVRYLPVDVSGAILVESAQALVDRWPSMPVYGLIGTYEQAFDALPARELPARVIAFLGSTIGNLAPGEAEAFLARAASAMRPGEYFLIGFDLQKDPAVIEAAYNDAAGVTAAFNLNMLHHLNRRFDGDFEPDMFSHRAFYNRELHRIEMHLVSGEEQDVRLEALDLSVRFAAGESVRTEISRKFSIDGMSATFDELGFDRVQAWTDENDWFALCLFRLRG